MASIKPLVPTGIDRFLPAGVPVNHQGVPLRPDRLRTAAGEPTTDPQQAVYAAQATDPAGKMNYVFGTRKLYTCFDFCVLDDGRVMLHALGGPGFDHEAFGLATDGPAAITIAQNMVADALDLMDEILEEEGMVLVDETVWGQNPFHFGNSIGKALGIAPFAHMNDRELRYGDLEWARETVLAALAGVNCPGISVEHRNLNLVVGDRVLIEQVVPEDPDAEISWFVFAGLDEDAEMISEGVDIHTAAVATAMEFALDRITDKFSELDQEKAARFPDVAQALAISKHKNVVSLDSRRGLR